MDTDAKYDAIVVGSGPNGLAAAIALQQEGLSVKIIEGKEVVGGGIRTAELTLPGFKHDICSAIHPLTYTSPFFKNLPLEEHGLKWLFPKIAVAHPIFNESAPFVVTSLENTARNLGNDAKKYYRLMRTFVHNWDVIAQDTLAPLSFPSDPFLIAKFGIKALQPVEFFNPRYFKEERTRTLFSGMAAHSIIPHDKFGTTAFGLMLSITAHTTGWPFPKGGAAKIADALLSYFKSLGGVIETGRFIHDIDELPKDKPILLDVTPKQLLQIAGKRMNWLYNYQLKKYKYGAGVFKIDWALSEPVPFTDPILKKAGTLHLGTNSKTIALSEKQVYNGKIPDEPFIILAQHTIFDMERAPEGKHTLWGYCHVPNGSSVDMTAKMEAMIEKHAPGFKDTILARHVFNATEIEDHNPNYIGGDINGGMQHLPQLFMRPTFSLSPYTTPDKNIFICSSSTPPGGGVHGMCGYYAARKVLANHFNKSINLS